MGTHLDFWFCPDVARDATAPVRDRVLGALWDLDVIERTPLPPQKYDRGTRYRMSDGIRQHVADPNGITLYASMFLEVLEGCAVHGIDIAQARSFTCPACGAHPDLSATSKVMMDAVASFYEDDQIPPVTCPACGKASLPKDWDGDPPPFIAHLGFSFADWVSLDSQRHSGEDTGYYITDIPAVMEMAAQTRLRHSWGKH